jgi:membrane-associated protease RseP (regulator of RpoE activity)
MTATLKIWLKHLLFLFITTITLTIGGLIQPFGLIPHHLRGEHPATNGLGEEIALLPRIYVDTVRTTLEFLFAADGYYLVYGLKFSLSFIFIMICHEMGHYVACRLYRVDASLPYFIPTPPMIGPGSLGAFIRIRDLMPSRKAVFDIGVAGPIAGFIALLPVAFLAFSTWESVGAAPLEPTGASFYFSNGIFTRLMAALFGVDLSLPMAPNPFYMAMWFGLLVTALNLIPSGQLDGGHAVYAVFGERLHYLLGRVAFFTMAALSVLGLVLYSAPSGFLFAILLAIMLRIGHPPPLDETPLDTKRKVIAVLTLLIFILCFVPFPIQLY